MESGSQQVMNFEQSPDPSERALLWQRELFRQREPRGQRPGGGNGLTHWKQITESGTDGPAQESGALRSKTRAAAISSCTVGVIVLFYTLLHIMTLGVTKTRLTCSWVVLTELWMGLISMW